MTLILPRRRFLAGLVGLVAAPAVIKASSLMKIAAPRTLPLKMLNAAREEWIEKMVRPPMMTSMIPFDTGLPWPSKSISYVHHRADLIDLGEPYLSAIVKYRATLNQSADPA